MTFALLQFLGVFVAALGVALQGWYLRYGVLDYQDHSRKRAEVLARSMPDADRAEREEEFQAILFFVGARITASVFLGLIHLIVVISIAIVVEVASNQPSPAGYELSFLRIAVSGLVIIGTSAQLIARWWALRR